MKKLFFFSLLTSFFLLFISFFHIDSPAYAADVCVGHDPTTGIKQNGICYFVSDNKPGYTTDLQSSCPRGTDCPHSLQSCSQMTGSDYHKNPNYHMIPGDVTGCPALRGADETCCAQNNSVSADECQGYETGSHVVEQGICFYYTENAPNYTTSDPTCTIGQTCGKQVTQDCSTMTGNLLKDKNYHNISDTIKNCSLNFGSGYKCCASDKQTAVAPPPPCNLDKKGNCTSVSTAFGNISTDLPAAIAKIFGIILSFSGGIVLILIIISGYRIMTAQGDPEKLKGAREMLTSAIVGFLFIIFSIAILRIIGVDILHIPGFQ